MEFFAGASGAIIGPKGAKISEIKKSTGVKDIKMPAKNEDGPRPKARDLVELTIVGKGRAVAKAREMIQAVVDEWVRRVVQICSAVGVTTNLGTNAEERSSPKPRWWWW